MMSAAGLLGRSWRQSMRPRCPLPSFKPQPIRRFAQLKFAGNAPRKALLRAPRSPHIWICTLSPLAFVKLADEDSNEGETNEDRMLEASRNELEQERKTSSSGSSLVRLCWRLWLIFDDWIYEPIATSLRFLHLVAIFVPVIVAVPAVYLGRRRDDQDNERAGTIWWYGFLVRSMERAGPAFIKLGQWAASRRDIFPAELCNFLSSLHSNAPAHSIQDTRRIIRQAFDGREFDEIFEEFQEKPLGVGAIAQVYKAKLKADLASSIGDSRSDSTANLRQRVRQNVDALVKSTPEHVPSSYVAIKVLHPKVERTVRRDLRIMSFFARALNLIPTLEWLSFPDEVDMFAKMMQLQLDLRIESANLLKFRRNFHLRPTVTFPFPFVEYTTRQVLVEEFAQGIPLSDFLDNGAGVFAEELAGGGLDAFLRMLLIDNFVHADLHPGNIMVRFYKPAQPGLVQTFSRSNSAADADDTSNPTDSGADVTEEVLSQLRPHRRDPKQWTAQLANIDAAGYRPQLIFIDTGLVTALNANNRRNFLDLFRAVAEFDGYRAGHLMVERCRTPDAVVDKEVFALKMQHLVLGVKSRTFALGSVSIGDILNEVLAMVRNHHVRMEGDFVNVVISILLLEGIGRTLDPDLDLFKSALPILRELGAQGGGASIVRSARSGDFSILKVWVGLEARKFLQASIEDVERCVRYDRLSPNI